MAVQNISIEIPPFFNFFFQNGDKKLKDDFVRGFRLPLFFGFLFILLRELKNKGVCKINEKGKKKA